MASFYDDFTGDLSNWIISSGAPVNRSWYLEDGLLKVEDAVSGKYGLIRYKNPLDVNGNMVVKYNGLNKYIIDRYNYIILRYTDMNHFVCIGINAGQDDNRGVVIHYNDLDFDINTDPISIPLYNSNGVPLTSESSPNKTIIPSTGIVNITFEENRYDVELYTSTSAFVASGSYIDPDYNNVNSGYVGFAHNNGWDANIDGWDYISIDDYGYVLTPPTITSFSASDDIINLGDGVTLGWLVNSGSNSANVLLSPNNINVPLSDIFTDYPVIDTTYTLSAWNDLGDDVKTLMVDVNDIFPRILDFSNNGPISASNSATLFWNISGATSAYIDNGIGWIEPYTSAGYYNIPELFVDTTYTLSAYDSYLNLSTSSTTVVVDQLPTGTLIVSGAPTCSGSEYNLIWDTQNATSAFLDDIGSVALSGSMTVTATVPKNHVLTVYNDLGLANINANALVYYRPPYAEIVNISQVNSEDGIPVEIFVDGSNSYSPENLPLTYTWYIDGDEVVTLNEPIDELTFPVGVSTLGLKVTDSCGFYSSASTNVVVTDLIPPVAVAEADRYLLGTSGNVNVYGNNSYDDDGVVVSYNWYKDSVLVSNSISASIPITSYKTHDITLVVYDNDGLSDSDTIQVLLDSSVAPVADAGGDIKLCTSGTTQVNLDGTNSRNPIYVDDSVIVWYEWNLSDFGIPNVSANISTTDEIGYSFNTNAVGTLSASLTVSADNGCLDTDVVNIRIYNKPKINSLTPDFTKVIADGSITTPVTLVVNAVANTTNPIYFWSCNGKYSNDKTFTLNLPVGVHYAYVYVEDVDTGCISETKSVKISVVDSSLRIIDFEVTPSYAHVHNGTPTNLELSWNISNATSAYIDGIGSVDPVTGIVEHPTPVTATENREFIISAFNNNGDVVTKTIWGQYIYSKKSVIQSCKQRDDIIVTYGLDELKYSKDRYINLVNYLPDYVRGTDTEILLKKFEDYLNNMFKDQRNYTWDEKELEVVSDLYTSANNIHSSCNDMFYDCCVSGVGCDNNYYGLSGAIYTSACRGDCGILPVPSPANKYSFDNDSESIFAETPAYSAGEIFVDNMCNITSDKISILDKIFRLTELFDPDLIPIELIQHYAENLGYTAGINRDDVYASGDDIARELEQKRYLRFMIRNLPIWYQIKSTPAAIAILLYSFGLIGNFVYYYTRCYSDRYDDKSQGICGSEDGMTDIDLNNIEYKGCTTNACNKPIRNLDNYTAKDIANERCCLSKYRQDVEVLEQNIKNLNGRSVDDWILTGVNYKSLMEDLNPVVGMEDRHHGFFSTPHFKIWVDIEQSTGNYSTDKERQRTMESAVEAIRPINTVFEGISVYFKTDSVLMYMNATNRVRKSINIVSDGTWIAYNPG